MSNSFVLSVPSVVKKSVFCLLIAVLCVGIAAAAGLSRRHQPMMPIVHRPCSRLEGWRPRRPLSSDLRPLTSAAPESVAIDNLHQQIMTERNGS